MLLGYLAIAVVGFVIGAVRSHLQTLSDNARGIGNPAGSYRATSAIVVSGVAHAVLLVGAASIASAFLLAVRWGWRRWRRHEAIERPVSPLWKPLRTITVIIAIPMCLGAVAVVGIGIATRPNYRLIATSTSPDGRLRLDSEFVMGFERSYRRLRLIDVASGKDHFFCENAGGALSGRFVTDDAIEVVGVDPWGKPYEDNNAGWSFEVDPVTLDAVGNSPC